MKSLGLLLLLGTLGLSARGLDREAFSFTHYDLEVRVEPGQQRLAVRGKVVLRNDSDAAQKNAVFQISSSLNWVSIQVSGKPVEFLSQPYISDIDHTGALTEAVVTLPRPVQPKATITLDVGYEGTIPQDATRLTRIGTPPEVAKHSDWDQISPSFSAVRGLGNVAWYPIATDSASLSEQNSEIETVGSWKRREAGAEMRVKFSLLPDSPESKAAVFCGGDTLEASGHRECVFRNLDSDVPFFVVGEFSLLERPTAKAFYLSDHKTQADDYGLALDECEEFIEKWFGDRAGTVASKAEVIELADPKAASFESDGVLLTPFSGNENSYLLSAVALLAHRAIPSPRAWIREGFARFAQAALIEEKEGRDAAIEYLRSHRSALVESENLVLAATSQAARSLINADDDFYIQTKAMSVWWMLRDTVGDDALKTALRNYKSDQDKSPSYIQKLVEAQAHRDLEWFFDDWVYRDRGLPDFRIVSVYPRELVNAGYMVTVTIENRGSAGAEVPVSLRMANGERGERLVVPAKSTASVRILCPSLPQQATVSDGSVPESDEGNNVYKIEP